MLFYQQLLSNFHLVIEGFEGCVSGTCLISILSLKALFKAFTDEMEIRQDPLTQPPKLSLTRWKLDKSH
jgi:hypothetical protein